jgi:hypothetical protein
MIFGQFAMEVFCFFRRKFRPDVSQLPDENSILSISITLCLLLVLMTHHRILLQILVGRFDELVEIPLRFFQRSACSHFRYHFRDPLSISKVLLLWIDAIPVDMAFTSILVHFGTLISRFPDFTTLAHLNKSVFGRKVKNFQCFYFKIFTPWLR